MRTMLCDQMKGLERQKVQGVRDLVMIGYDGDPDERVLKSSMALGQAIQRGETKLEDLVEPLTAELEDTYVPVQEYLASAALEETIVEGSDGETRDASPSPPLPTAWPLLLGEDAKEESCLPPSPPTTSGVRGEDMEEERCPPPPPPVPSAWPAMLGEIERGASVGASSWAGPPKLSPNTWTS